ncbi:hypothetical protein H1C71_041869 [Ictidomys tridecemlineatus]|nr:hypothetical protein H1C71_041869 [Ictidomys tridecemlineatus]
MYNCQRLANVPQWANVFIDCGTPNNGILLNPEKKQATQHDDAGDWDVRDSGRRESEMQDFHWVAFWERQSYGALEGQLDRRRACLACTGPWVQSLAPYLHTKVSGFRGRGRVEHTGVPAQ